MEQSTLTRLERFRLRYGWGYESSDFDYYELHHRNGRDLTEYLGYAWFRYRLRPMLNSKWARSVTDDKWIASRIFDSLGLPIPRTFGLYDRNQGITWDLARPLRTVPDLMAELDRLRPPGVVVKPNGGQQGERLLVLESIDYDSGQVVTRTGEETTLEEALRGVAVDDAVGGYPGYVVQEFVRNHPSLAQLAPYATNTLRVQTLLANGGTVHILGAVLRLSRRGQAVDNYSQGGLAVAVDPDTGVMGRGSHKDDHRPRSEHPDSGIEVEGRQVPCWDEVAALVRRGAGGITGLRAVGWDVAVTPTGPVLIEANHNWGMQILQAQTDGYLADPEFRAWMTDLGVPLPTGGVLRGLSSRWLWPLLDRVSK
jgi:Sugar-transfer associated ATP-grasp